jgi:hypothetical protein
VDACNRSLCLLQHLRGDRLQDACFFLASPIASSSRNYNNNDSHATTTTGCAGCAERVTKYLDEIEKGVPGTVNITMRISLIIRAAFRSCCCHILHHTQG